MGKQLIIKGADFSQNGLPVRDITSQALRSDHHQFLHYPNQAGGPGFTDAFQLLGSSSPTGIYVIDIGAYEGKIIRFTKSRSKKSEEFEDSPVYYACFASAIAVAVPYNGATCDNACTVVKHIDGKGTGTDAISTYVEVIPEGAKYLVTSVNPNNCPFSNVKFEIIG